MDGFTRYFPHVGQQAIHASDRRFRIVCCGRRWGKTLCLAAEILNRAHHDGGGDYGWVAPTYNVAERAIDAIRQFAGDVVSIVGRAPATVKIPTADGSSARLFILSADNPDSMRGYGFRGLVIDEAASVDQNVWDYVLRPTISQTLGWAVIISTPAGRNWFYDLFTRGNDASEADYASFRFPSNSSPYFPNEEFEEARRTLPSDVFRQEYEAEFLEDSAGVFRGVDACLCDATPATFGDVAIGCDIAKHTDFTVLTAMDRKTGACLAMDRFNHLDWPIQKERILAFCQKWRGLLVLDATGVGDAIYDDLAAKWPRIEPVKFSNLTKTQLVQRLIVSIEQRQIQWPRAWEIMTDEVKRYEYAIGATGTITYNAPSGFHDDCVMSLALANHRRYLYVPTGTMATLPAYTRKIRSLI